MDVEQAQARGDLDVQVVDLCDDTLPSWRGRIQPGWHDGLIFVMPGYNLSITGALRSAID